jgi:HEPN domain-containing protein
MTPPTGEWVSKAEGDFDMIAVLRRSRKPTRYDLICFLCQQCAEKYMKARLNEARVSFPKTHNLEERLDLLKPIEPLWLVMRLDFRQLTHFAVAVRYPGKHATPANAADAFQTCRRLRSLARASLGLKS